MDELDQAYPEDSGPHKFSQPRSQQPHQIEYENTTGSLDLWDHGGVEVIHCTAMPGPPLLDPAQFLIIDKIWIKRYEVDL